MVVDISFVVIEYFCIDELNRCVGSIRSNCSGLSHEIIVSSNSNYLPAERDRLKSQFRDTTWVFNKDNIGFAKAMNAGIKRSSGKVVTIMNPDTQIIGGSVLSAYRSLLLNEDWGSLGPKMVDSNNNLQDTCRGFMTPIGLLTRAALRLFLRNDVILNKDFDYAKTQPVDWVIGAFMMLKRETMDKVGLLDEGYFLYVEDMDWCRRIWNAGFKVVYFPELLVQYKGDRKSVAPLMSKKILNRYSIQHLKSYLRFVRKHQFYFYKK